MPSHLPHLLNYIEQENVPKPSPGTSLYRALIRYSTYMETGANWDTVNEVRDLIAEKHPDWLDLPEYSAEKKRQELYEIMLDPTASKPSHDTPLGRAFSRYTVKASQQFEPAFYRIAKRARPEWFNSNQDRMIERRLLIMRYARDLTNHKPQPPHPMATSFRCLTNDTCKTFDPIFTRELCKVRPEWFTDCKQHTEAAKTSFRDMMSDSAATPLDDHHGLATTFLRLTTPGAAGYDAGFHRVVKARRPDWLDS